MAEKWIVEGWVPVGYSYEGIEAETREEAEKKAIELFDESVSCFGGEEKHFSDGEVNYTNNKE